LRNAQVQQHSFNLPYQLASPELLPEADTADDAAVYEIDALPGDILILGTDGLFDNMWNDQLERIVNTHVQVRPPAAPASASLSASPRFDSCDGPASPPFLSVN
jgi:serine/threonine protein phosphatase PrpC